MVPDSKCETCAQASTGITVALFVSLIMYIPSITTDVLRMYPHYDVNCQKVFAGFTAPISLGFSIYTFMIYQFRCFRSFSEVLALCINLETGEVVPSECDTGDNGQTTCWCPEG